MGPREVPRIWPRHILNCAVVAEQTQGLVPPTASVTDVGSGAGLPGLVWAMVRPDLSVNLVEPLARRVRFLELAVAELGLSDQVTIIRARAQEVPVGIGADIVTARAVAPLAKLVTWLLPLTKATGRVVAFKGSSAAAEVRRSRDELRSSGARSVEVVTCGDSWLGQPTTVVVVSRNERTGVKV